MSRNLDRNAFIENKGYIGQGLAVVKKAQATAAFILLLLVSAIAQFINLGQANPFIRDSKIIETIPPPEDTDPPEIFISSPKNLTYQSNSILLNFTATIEKSSNISLTVNEIYYIPSWKRGRTDVDLIQFLPNNNYSWPTVFSINLGDVPEGPHWIEVFAVATGFAYAIRHETKGVYYTTYYAGYEITGSSRIDFTVDTVAPSVLSLSVANMTYSTTDVQLTIKTNEPVSEVNYSLDGRRNLTATGNVTLTGLTNGDHHITVFATDSAGNKGASETAHFAVDLPEPFPTASVVASLATIAMVSVGFLGYLKKPRG